MTVRARALEHWDAEAGQWTVEPGAFHLQAGPSSTVLPLNIDVTVSSEEE